MHGAQQEIQARELREGRNIVLSHCEEMVRKVLIQGIVKMRLETRGQVVRDARVDCAPAYQPKTLGISRF